MKYLVLLLCLGCADTTAPPPPQGDYCESIGWGKTVTYLEASIRLGKTTAEFWFCDGVPQDGTAVKEHWEWFFGPNGEQMLRRVPPLIG